MKVTIKSIQKPKLLQFEPGQLVISKEYGYIYLLLDRTTEGSFKYLCLGREGHQPSNTVTDNGQFSPEKYGLFNGKITLENG